MVSCDRCRGLGWVKPVWALPDVWPEVCTTCEGKGSLTVVELASLLCVSVSTARRFLAGKKLRTRTYLRLIDGLLAVSS